MIEVKEGGHAVGEGEIETCENWNFLPPHVDQNYVGWGFQGSWGLRPHGAVEDPGVLDTTKTNGETALLEARLCPVLNLHSWWFNAPRKCKVLEFVTQQLRFNFSTLGQCEVFACAVDFPSRCTTSVPDSGQTLLCLGKIFQVVPFVSVPDSVYVLFRLMWVGAGLRTVELEVVIFSLFP